MKKVKLFEEFIGESYTIGEDNWKDILSDLKRKGWKIEGWTAIKQIGDSTDRKHIELEHDEGYTGNILWTVYSGDTVVISNGEFDANGLSAKELDKEIWNNIDEATATALHEYDFLGMQAQAANMSREEWIAHYGTPEIGCGIDEAKKSIYTVFFDDKNGMDWDWEVEATSPEEAIKLLQDYKAKGPHGENLPRGARNFTAKLYK